MTGKVIHNATARAIGSRGRPSRAQFRQDARKAERNDTGLLDWPAWCCADVCTAAPVVLTMKDRRVRELKVFSLCSQSVLTLPSAAYLLKTRMDAGSTRFAFTVAVDWEKYPACRRLHAVTLPAGRAGSRQRPCAACPGDSPTGSSWPGALPGKWHGCRRRIRRHAPDAQAAAL